MKYDFGGYATRNDLTCSDGRVIKKDAFKAQNGQTVPLVWNHNHDDVNDVLGLAHLENRKDGVYAYCEFNDTDNGKTAKELVQHGDVKSLSIFANQLMQKGSDVIHGLIREVSLVLAGANPGAFIDDVIAHGEDGSGIIACYDEGVTVFMHSDDKPDNKEKTEDSKEMIKETQELGGFITPYINGRLWDPATDSYKTLNGKDASCRKADGTLYTEVYSSKVLNTVTCPASYIWRDVLKGVNKQILTELKTNGVYMDQIGCANSEPCYATNHGHAPGGGDWWPFAYRSLLTEMRTNLYKENQAMTTEENAECYIDLFDMMLVVNSPHNSYTKMVPLFPLIYSDRCIYSGYTYIPWRITDGSLNFMSMRSLLWGSQLGWVEPSLLMRPDAKREAKFLKNLTDFRRQQHDLFLGGRFIQEIIPTGDNPTQEIPNYEITPVVLAAEWASVSGEHVYLIVNMSEQEHKVTLPNKKQITVKALDAIRISK